MNMQITGIAWPSDLLRTSEFLDKTSQIAVYTLVRTIDKAQETKLRRDKS